MARRRNLGGTPAQFRYITYLEQLTSLRTQGTVGARIKRLQEEAARLGLPEYKWKPFPVKTITDPSIRRTTRSSGGRRRGGSTGGQDRPPRRANTDTEGDINES